MNSVDSMKKSISYFLLGLHRERHDAENRQGVKVSNWNIVDSIIYFTENIISKVIDGVRESKDTLPEPEEMIEAATKELQEEKEALLQYRIPGQMVKLGEYYACPKCRTILSEPLKYKYCPECGKRIMFPEVCLYK